MKIKGLWLHNARQFGTFLGLLAIIIIFSWWTPYFFTVSNLLNVAQQTTINAIIAVGMTYVIITAGIDLSVGSIMAFSGVVLASLLKADQPMVIAVMGGLLVGAVCGFINGMLISYGKLQPFISTLGLMSVARGAALLYTDGRPISGFDQDFRFIATGEILHIPLPIFIMIAIYLIGHFVLTKTKLGRYTYATGGNEQAAILSGVNVKYIKIVIYSLCGLLSGAAGVLLTARLNSAQPIAGIMYELDAIAATVIGGTSLMGGEGKLTGTLIGALIMGVLRNGLNILDVSSFIQQIVIGSVIICAVLIDMSLKKKRT